MILFISENKLNFDLPEVQKQDKINKDNIVRFFKSNAKKLYKMDYLIVDDELIESDEDFIEIKKIIENKLILFSNHKEALKKYSNNLYIFKNKDKSLHKQLDDIINRVTIKLDEEEILQKSTLVEESQLLQELDEKEEHQVIYQEEQSYMDEESQEDIQTKMTIDRPIEFAQENKEEIQSVSESYEEEKKEEQTQISESKKALLDKLNNFHNTDKIEKNNKALSVKEKIALKKAEELKKKLKNKCLNIDNIIEEEKEIIQEDTSVEKVIYNPEKEKERKKKIEYLLSDFKDDRYVKDEDIDKMMDSNYVPRSNRDDIFILKNKQNKEENIIEKEEKTEKEKKSLFKIPKISIPKIEKKEKINKQKGEQSTSNVFISNTSSEIAVFGGENGVGTTYCCIKLAQDILNIRKNVSIGYYQYCQKEKELLIIKHSIEQGKISDRFNVYENTIEGVLKAYRENEIVIIDFGYLDKLDKELLMNITKIRGDKYMVVNYSFNTFTSINNAISFSEYENFKTIFNMYDSSKLIKLQKEFQDLDIMIFDFQPI